MTLPNSGRTKAKLNEKKKSKAPRASPGIPPYFNNVFSMVVKSGLLNQEEKH